VAVRLARAGATELQRETKAGSRAYTGSTKRRCLRETTDGRFGGCGAFDASEDKATRKRGGVFGKSLRAWLRRKRKWRASDIEAEDSPEGIPEALASRKRSGGERKSRQTYPARLQGCPPGSGLERAAEGRKDRLSPDRPIIRPR
jgi:hypothetical protein